MQLYSDGTTNNQNISSRATSSIPRVILSPQNRARFLNVGSPSNSRLPGESLLPLHFKPEDPPLRPRSNRRNFEQLLRVGQHPELPAFNTIQLPPHPYYNPTTTTQDTSPTVEGVFDLNDLNSSFLRLLRLRSFIFYRSPLCVR
ncbi:hypothetical protein JCM5350_003920 [Sporobolomyces pararoseus]